MGCKDSFKGIQAIYLAPSDYVLEEEKKLMEDIKSGLVKVITSELKELGCADQEIDLYLDSKWKLKPY